MVALLLSALAAATALPLALPGAHTTAGPVLAASLAAAVAAYGRAVTSPPLATEHGVFDVALVEPSPRHAADLLVLKARGAGWRISQRSVLSGVGELAPGRFSAASRGAPEWLTPLTLPGRVRAVVFDELEAGGWGGLVLVQRAGNFSVAPVDGSRALLQNPHVTQSGTLTTAAVQCTPNCARGGWVDRRYRFVPDRLSFVASGATRRVGPGAAPGAPPHRV